MPTHRGGPAPKPTALRVLHGEKRYRINTDEPQPRELLPTPPEWLSEFAAAEWARVWPDLEHMRTAKAVDATALACYCEAVARFRVVTTVVNQSGPLLVGKDGTVRKNPAVGQARDASNDVRLWSRELGLTPAARQPLRVQHSNEAPADRLLSG